MKKRVCIIVPERPDADMLRMLFYYSQQYESIAPFATTKKALKILDNAPDLFLLSEKEIHEMPHLKNKFPATPILLLVKSRSDESVVKALSAGAANCVFRGSTPVEYLQTCDDILNDKVRISSSISLKLLSTQSDLEAAPSLQTMLTKREHDLLQLLRQGLQYKEISRNLEISIETVKRHCSNIYKKLGVSNRTEAVNIYFQRGTKSNR